RSSMTLFLRDRPRITRRPAAGIDTNEKIANDLIEQLGLLQIDNMAGLGKHHETRGGDRRFQEQTRFDAAVVLVADDDERRDRQPRDGVLKIVERGPRALEAARGARRALRIVLGQMFQKLREAARVLDRERNTARTVAVTFS